MADNRSSAKRSPARLTSALAVSAVNVLAALIALMTGSTDDASAGLVVGLIALGLTAATAYADRSGQPQSEPEPTSLSS